MSKYTKDHMVIYCQKFIDDLKQQIKEGRGEEWMNDAIEIEEAIIEVIKASEVSPESVMFKASKDKLI